MDKLKFYGDWLFFGGLFGVIVGGIWINIIRKKNYPKRVTGKQYVIIFAICLVPTAFLPLWLTPGGTFQIKLIGTLIAVIVGVLHYITITRAHESYKIK